MREPRSIISRQITPSRYFGEQSSEDQRPWFIVRLARAVGEGLLPVVILVALIALFWEASVIGRIFTLQRGIDLVQRVAEVTVGGGLIVSVIVYLIAATRTLQNVRDHQRNGEQLEALITLILLALSSLVMLYPLFRAIMAVQHPAP